MLHCQGKIKVSAFGEESGFLSGGQSEMLRILENSYTKRHMNVIVSQSGCGKTYTVEQFLKRHANDTLYIRCKETMSVLGVIEEMSRKLGLSSGGTATSRLGRISDALRDRGYRLVVVDEADLLLSDDSSSAKKIIRKISLFRNLYEDGIGVCLIGLNEMAHTLKRAQETYFNSRVYWMLEPPLPTDRELEYFWTVTLGQASKGKLVGLAREKGFFRFLRMQAEKARELADQVSAEGERKSRVTVGATPSAAASAVGETAVLEERATMSADGALITGVAEGSRERGRIERSVI